jgi:MFS family permease
MLIGQEKVRLVWKVFFVLLSAVMGFGWALININSFPMVVEYSNSKNLGKFTGYYYIASMLAQSITPIIIGVIMDKSSLGQRLLFVYSGVLMIAALVVFILVKEKFSVKERLEKYGSSDKGVLGNLGSMDD